MNTETTPQARVSRITVGRLHNLGNYEHVRYEIAVDVPEGASAAATLGNIERILADLDPKPPVNEYELQNAVKGLAKPAAEMEEYELSNIPCWKDRVAKDKAWREGRQAARAALDDVGGSRIYTDAKDTWDDEH